MQTESPRERLTLVSFRTVVLLSLLAAASACHDDADEDGDHWLGDEDCDDEDPLVHPGAIELCNHLDDDCDGTVDNGFDLDADGFFVCSDPPDCDDANPALNPEAVDECDGIDNDCDGSIDEAAQDADGDGVTACDGDCDDEEPRRAPGLTEFRDGLDNDCDGEVDEVWEGTVDLARLPLAVGPGPTEPRFGAALAAGDLNGDGFGDLVVGSPGAEDDAGEVAIYLGREISPEEDTSAWVADTLLEGAEPAGHFGSALAVGDLDDDGLDDLVVGSPADGGTVSVFLAAASGGPAHATIRGDDGEGCGSALAILASDDASDILVIGCPTADEGEGEGRVLLFDGSALTTGDLSAQDALAVIYAEAGDGLFGAALAAPDLDADETADLLIGSPGYHRANNAGLPNGRVVVFLAVGDTTAAELSAADADRSWSGSDGYAIGGWLGSGDPVVPHTMLLGAPAGQDDLGMLGVLFGGSSPPESGSGWSATTFYVAGRGESSDAVGTSAALIDIDRDGVSDLLVGVPGDPDPDGEGVRGRIDLLLGPLDTISGFQSLPSLTSASLVGATPDAHAGSVLVSVPDFDGDGWPEAAVACPGGGVVQLLR